MDLIKIENEEKGVFYFTTYGKAGQFLEVHPNSIRNACHGACKVKGFECRWIESDDILSRHIDNSREDYLTLFGRSGDTHIKDKKRKFQMRGYCFENDKVLILLYGDECIIAENGNNEVEDAITVGLFNSSGFLSDESLARIANKLECLDLSRGMIKFFMNKVLDLYVKCYDFDTKTVKDNVFIQILDDDNERLIEFGLTLVFLIAKIN